MNYCYDHSFALRTTTIFLNNLYIGLHFTISQVTDYRPIFMVSANIGPIHTNFENYVICLSRGNIS